MADLSPRPGAHANHPARRLIAAGFIRRATGRVLTLDATGTRVTGSIRPTAAAPTCCGRPMRDKDGQYVCPRCGAWTQYATRAARVAELHRQAAADYASSADRRAQDHRDDAFLIAQASVAAGVVASR
ncbi:hypothetical protein ACFY30_22150 [Streptomyces sp. NPDC000345]|uniref:hypothetical protein n=1 Tax=Streptomyces sp. NPDC000345 TaxID=3364537 RepID=UPI003675F1BD